ncbi:unnamed protein product [Rotaria magnacalcarata]|uniref:Uncharacterized protein n=1 Tax=Rotaria magnacalcarata TaxID=392030 RepID=A0A815HT21_9BILA|nr:unnamed protein product [Rotaria magnacalcarata]CAF1354708.1 unnamed protein product [Rotaria magnacalcarata]CAF1916384.1 unnamed protein product [Rotaria magnacalcarata]CAF2030467.1 unnamed protein product [Rotaria magnacalcarata]CAF2082849.1 unnamed protein product [Rotaria magnacalcarata]
MYFRSAQLCVMFALFISIFIHIILWSDRSTTSELCLSNKTNCHHVNIYGHSNQMRCYPLLINFAHQCCGISQKNNCDTGLTFGMAQCLKLNMNIFKSDDGFRQRNSDLLNYYRGGGYWLWKPYILWHELYAAREGDVIVYSDAAVNFVSDINILIRLMGQQDIMTFRQTNHSESAYTKRDTFILMQADSKRFVESTAAVASYVLVRKSVQSLAFVSEWLTYVQDGRAVSDDRNVLGQPNYPNFVGHRHDQSILGLLVKKWNLTTYPDPSQHGESVPRPYPTILKHHRKKL